MLEWRCRPIVEDLDVLEECCPGPGFTPGVPLLMSDQVGIISFLPPWSDIPIRHRRKVTPTAGRRQVWSTWPESFLRMKDQDMPIAMIVARTKRPIQATVPYSRKFKMP